MAKISRRDFLKGSAALGLMSASLMGCSTPAETPETVIQEVIKEVEKEVVKEVEVIKEPELLYTAYVNPQRTDYRSNTKELKTLFSPVTFGSITINNRIVKSAAGSACYLAGLTDELLTYYVNIAKGGCEMIYVESVAALEPPMDGSDYAPETFAFGKKMVDECAKYGASLGYQYSGFSMGINGMTIDEIVAAEDRIARLAKGMQSMGFKALEMNVAGFNMGEHFLSRFHNSRTDEYGPQSFENRARFVTNAIKKVKAACGADFNVQILIDAIEENDNIANNPTLMTLDDAVTHPHTKVTSYEEGIELAKEFEKAGADSMHLRIGPLGHHVAQFGSDLYFILNGIEGATGFGTQYDFDQHWQGMFIGDTQGCGSLLNVAAEYKKALKIPCGAVTYMDPAHAPDMFEDALAEGKVDFLLMTRPLTVDMEYINKLKEGRIDEIAPCTRCLHCHIGSNEMNAISGYCRVNALTQRVMRANGPATYEVPKADKAKKVMVIGGGPAGMEAARIAAMKGHDVTLFEKKPALGGLLDFAHMVKGPHENLEDLKKYLIRQLELKGVKVELGVEVDQAKIKEFAPDAVILAVGGARPTLTVNGDIPVIGIDNAMFTEMGQKVVVYGSNAQAYDMALWLTVHKKHVTIITPSKNEELDMQQSQHAKRMMTTALYALGVRAWPESEIVSAKDGKVVIKGVTGAQHSFKCDAIVDCSDMLPNTSLLDGCGVAETYAVGDCANPFNIGKAIMTGNDAGRAV